MAGRVQSATNHLIEFICDLQAVVVFRRPDELFVESFQPSYEKSLLLLRQNTFRW